MKESGDLRNLLDTWEQLADRERQALLLFAKRVLQGQKVFGPLSKGKKPWAANTVEEGIDAAAYLTFLAIDLAEQEDKPRLTTHDSSKCPEGFRGCQNCR